MAAMILDGRAVAAGVRDRTRAAVAERIARGGRAPGLAVVLVGDDPASAAYVRSKEKACRETGIRSETVRRPISTSTAELTALVGELNDRPDVDGILVQLPLPAAVDEQAVLQAVRLDKDVDGFHPVNVGRLAMGLPARAPCTPAGVMELLAAYGIELTGREAVVLGRSNIVGRPMAQLLLRANATVTVCHSRTRELAAVCRRADVLVAAVGRAGLVTAEFVKPGAAVIDVGMNRIGPAEAWPALLAPGTRTARELADKGRVLVGDVRFEEAAEVAGAITPVPGGVGPMTVAMLVSALV